MKYFIHTEFHEYHKQPKVCGIKVGKAIPTVDLISIGIVSEDNREYYAISKDFNIKDVWNSYRIERYDVVGHLNSVPKKVYWMRENVLLPIHYELASKEGATPSFEVWREVVTERDKGKYGDRHLKTLRKLIRKYGKTNNEIAREIICFCNPDFYNEDMSFTGRLFSSDTPEFYTYYGSFDWVAITQIFGRIIDVPPGFPWNAIELNQMLDGKVESLKYDKDFPKEAKEHHALQEAKFNKELYDYIQKKLKKKRLLTK